MILFSLILIVNKQKIYKEFLESLGTQTNADYEVIFIDNCENQYNSARKAYDIAAEKALGRYIIFLHPDIRFNNFSVLYNIGLLIEQLGDFGVVGVAGCPEELVNNKRIILSNMVHGKDKINVGYTIRKAEEVQTVDECLFVVKRDEYMKVHFSEKVGWHLYGVELCLQFLNAGKKNYVIPADIWHLSDGKSLDYRYVIQIKDLIKEYGSLVDTINTTVKKWSTKGILGQLYILYYIVKQWMKKIIKH